MHRPVRRRGQQHPGGRLRREGHRRLQHPGANANAVKELVICALLLASRKIAAGIAWVQALKGQGDQVSPQVEKGKSAFVGPEIAGKTLGIVGLGAIGRLVAGAARALGMEVIGYDPFLTPATQQELGETVRIVTDLDEIYAQSDYITLHVPAHAETKGMICQANIAKMKAGARIINLARGELVVDADVIAALGDGRLGAYVTDFATDALLGVDGVTPLPHLGASTPESEDNCASMAALEVIDFPGKRQHQKLGQLPRRRPARQRQRARRPVPRRWGGRGGAAAPGRPDHYPAAAKGRKGPGGLHPGRRHRRHRRHPPPPWPSWRACAGRGCCKQDPIQLHRV